MNYRRVEFVDVGFQVDGKVNGVETNQETGYDGGLIRREQRLLVVQFSVKHKK